MASLHPFVLRAVVAAALLLKATGAPAQPPRDRILEAVHITQEPGCVQINVGLSYPFRYRSHFPYSSGEELRIKIQPISVSRVDSSALYGREGTTPKLPKGAEQLGVEILEIVYEGDIPGGPYLTIFFRHPVSFQVAQGGDSRSVVIASSGPEALPSCQPSLAPKR